jgi:Na+/melibiose symporter-like transporter
MSLHSLKEEQKTMVFFVFPPLSFKSLISHEKVLSTSPSLLAICTTYLIFSLSGERNTSWGFCMSSILIMFSLVLALAVAVKQSTGAFTKAQTFPTCEYATQNGVFPGPAVTETLF